MKIRIKLATFREYRYHVEDNPPTGTSGVYGEVYCSDCGRVYRDKGCTELDITNPGGWYAAQIDCVCKKNFIQYEGHEVYVADVEKAIIKDIPKKEVKPVRVKSKYADVNTNQYLQSGPRNTDELNTDVALKDQICKGCGTPFMIEGLDAFVDDLVERKVSECEVYCRCSANTSGGYSIVFDYEEAEEVYHFGDEDEEEDIEASEVESKYGDVYAVQYYSDDTHQGEEVVKNSSVNILKHQCCENCGTNFLTEDVDKIIELSIRHAPNEEIVIECLGCDSDYYLLIDYADAMEIYNPAAFKQVKDYAEGIKAYAEGITKGNTYKVSHTKAPEVSVEDTFFSEVDPNGLESSFFKA